MLSDERLGAALREAFDDLVGDLHPSLALLDRVDAIGAQARRPGARGPRVQARGPRVQARGPRVQARGPRVQARGPRALRRWTLVTAPLVAVALIVTAIATLGSSGVTPSFAVTRGAGGTVLITINQLEGITAANRRLRRLGARAVVVRMSAACPTHFPLTAMGGAERPSEPVRLQAGQIPRGTTILLAAAQIGPGKIEFAVGRTTGRPPACVALIKRGPGLSPRSTWTG